MHKDATGRRITRGDYVAYSTANRSSSGIKFGSVVKLKEKPVKRSRYNPQTKQYDMHDEIDYSISIVSVDKGSHYDQQTQSYTSKWKIQGKVDEGRPARVQHIDRLERVIILEPHQMEPEAKELLDKELHERGTI